MTGHIGKHDSLTRFMDPPSLWGGTGATSITPSARNIYRKTTIPPTLLRCLKYRRCEWPPGNDTISYFNPHLTGMRSLTEGEVLPSVKPFVSAPDGHGIASGDCQLNNLILVRNTLIEKQRPRPFQTFLPSVFINEFNF